MAERRFALIVASYKYEDPDLQQLMTPGQDAKALNSILSHPKIGGYEVTVLINEPSHRINQAVEEFYVDRQKDDVLLLYFSCHGIKDEDGQLYFAASDTRRKLLASTATSANFVNNIMLRSQCRRQVLFLDCCYSGAFARGMVSRADKKVDAGLQFEGKGRIILTASDAMQYSFEGDELSTLAPTFSFFTGSLIYGLQTGDADVNNDGFVTTDELYSYMFDKVTERTSSQRPQKWSFAEGDVVVAQNPHMMLNQVRTDQATQDITSHVGTKAPIPKSNRNKQTISTATREMFYNRKILAIILSAIFAISVITALVFTYKSELLHVVDMPNAEQARIEPTGLQGNISVGNHPTAVGINPNDNLIYVATDSDSVSVIDGNTNVVSQNVSVGENPFLLAVNPGSNMTYVNYENQQRSEGGVIAINGSKGNRVGGTFALDANQTVNSLLVKPGTDDSVYITSSIVDDFDYYTRNATMSILRDGLKGIANTTLFPFDYLDNLVYDEGTGKIFGIAFDDDEFNPQVGILVWDDSGTYANYRIINVTDDIDPGAEATVEPMDLAINSESGLVYLGLALYERNSSIYIDNPIFNGIVSYNMFTGNEVKRIPIDDDLKFMRIGFNPIGNTIYAAEPVYGNKTLIINALTGDTKKELDFPFSKLAVNYKTDLIYLTNFEDNSVYVVDAKTDTLLNSDL